MSLSPHFLNAAFLVQGIIFQKSKKKKKAHSDYFFSFLLETRHPELRVCQLRHVPAMQDAGISYILHFFFSELLRLEELESWVFYFFSSYPSIGDL